MITEKAFQETKDIGKNKCLLCNKDYTKEDIISMNMTPDEQEKIKKELIQKWEEAVRE